MTSFRTLLAAMMLCVMAAVPGCDAVTNTFLPSQFQSNRSGQPSAPLTPSEKNDFKAEWMGKSASDVEAKFGRPSQRESLEDTGGMRFYYQASQPHYLFEFNAQGKVTAAAIVD